MLTLPSFLIAAQAGLPPLDYSEVEGARRQKYFAAVLAALDREYEPMEQFFAAVIRRTCQKSGVTGDALSADHPGGNRTAANERPRLRSKR